jgi:FkbH-like protein
MSTNAISEKRNAAGMNTADLRQEIDRLIADGEASGASVLLAELWARESTPSAASFVVSRHEQLRPKLNLLPYRLAILRSFTVEPIIPLLRAGSFLAGIDLAVQASDFNAHVQEILDPQSPLYAFTPDAVILAVQTRDVAPELWRDFSDSNTEAVQAAIARVVGDFHSWIRNFRSHSRAHLIIHNLEEPVTPSRGILDEQLASSQVAAIQQINRELRALAAEQTGVYVLDYDALVARHGRNTWHDERKWLTVRLPMAAQNLSHLAQEWLRFLHPLTGKVAKALVVDLDNTLWGGVIGEDGMMGIKLGNEYPGAAFRDLQRALLDLHQRGILLAICSKNNREDAMEALQSHAGMLLKPHHFACTRINWTDKAQNLREIAKELNIGVDALAFLDDNPIERQQVRSQLPEVTVIELPRDPMQFARVVRQSPVFERLALSSEDQQRGAMYQAQREREQLEQNLTSREDFYRSLQQQAEIVPVTKASLARVAQLTNKTNQFNLTTRRYTEQQILEMTATAGCDCFSIRVRDRFGDNGLVGVAITRNSGEVCEIDTFLLSCRVIGRTVETAFLSFLAEQARRHGATKLQGWFLPTKKNAPAQEFYSAHGFVSIEQNDKGTLWSLDLKSNSLACPEWVKLHIVNGDRSE